MENQDKFRWHDLLKDPTDLPEGGIFHPVLVKRRGIKEVFTAKYCEDFGKKCWEVNNMHTFEDVLMSKKEFIAWREIDWPKES